LNNTNCNNIFWVSKLTNTFKSLTIELSCTTRKYYFIIVRRNRKINTISFLLKYFTNNWKKITPVEIFKIKTGRLFLMADDKRKTNATIRTSVLNRCSQCQCWSVSNTKTFSNSSDSQILGLYVDVDRTTVRPPNNLNTFHFYDCNNPNQFVQVCSWMCSMPSVGVYDKNANIQLWHTSWQRLCHLLVTLVPRPRDIVFL